MPKVKPYQIFRGTNEHGGLMVSAEPFSETILDLQVAINRADMFAQCFPKRDWMVNDMSDKWYPKRVHHVPGEQIWLVLPSSPDMSPGCECRVLLRCVEGTEKVDYGCYFLLLPNDDLFHPAIFTNLRDAAGAWIDCDRLRYDVAGALQLVWTADGAVGITRPPPKRKQFPSKLRRQ
jgi:hypothetical protein